MATYALETLADNFVFLEGPRWRDGRLWISDMWGHAIYRLDEQGRRSEVAKVANRPSGLSFLPDGSLIAVSMADRKLVRVGSDGALSDYADLSGLVGGDINDSVVDRDGNIYVGNFGYDLFSGAEAALANLVLVTPDGRCREVATGMNFPNGTVITPDGATLICAETFGHCLTAFDRQADGSLSGRRVWADLGERTPDGICLDADGAIWVASFVTGEFLRVREGGEITDVIAVPGKRAVACNLGGRDGRTLFALTFAGEMEDIPSGKPLAAVEVCKVAVGSGGSP